MECFDLCLIISVVGVEDGWKLLTKGIRGDESDEVKIRKDDLPPNLPELLKEKVFDDVQDYLSQIVGEVMVIKYDCFGALPKVDRFAAPAQSENFMRVMLLNMANQKSLQEK